MFEKRKAKKMGKEILRNMQAQQYANEQMKQMQTESQSGQGKTLGEFERAANFENLRRIMSLKNDIRENLIWVVMGTFLLIVEYFLVGIAFLLFSVMFFGLLIRIYTSKFYHVHMQRVFLLNLGSDTQTYMDFISIPFKIFRHIDTVGLENSIMTPEGPVFAIDDIEYEGDIPVRMRFSYSHFPAYKFLMKKETYSLMVQYINRLVLLDFKLRALMDLNTHAVASEMLREKMKRINEGRLEEAAQLQQERQQLLKDIAEQYHNLEMTEKKGETSKEEELNAE
jgi:hypothetical protein